jgi:hypothetical protein
VSSVRGLTGVVATRFTLVITVTSVTAGSPALRGAFLMCGFVASFSWTAALLHLSGLNVSGIAATIAAPASFCANRRRFASFPLQRIECAAWRVASLPERRTTFTLRSIHTTFSPRLAAFAAFHEFPYPAQQTSRVRARRQPTL